jgi:hypothetical protein
MKVKIKEDCWKWNCMWYCTEVGNIFKVDKANKYNCYEVTRKGKGKGWWIAKNHVSIVK